MIIYPQLKPIFNQIPQPAQRVLIKFPLEEKINEMSNLADLGPSTRNMLKIYIQMTILGMINENTLEEIIDELIENKIKALQVKNYIQDQIILPILKELSAQEINAQKDTVEMAEDILEGLNKLEAEMMLHQEPPPPPPIQYTEPSSNQSSQSDTIDIK